MNISASKARALALLPFGYFALTRLKSLRDLGYLIASSLLPAFWLLVRLTELDAATAALYLTLGYLAFISVYEVGYLANDAWDAKRSEEGRQRLSLRLKWPFIVTFLTVRAAAWIAVGYHTGWIENSTWLGGYAALVVAFSQHNLVQSRGLRLASFYELAALRFLLPIVAVISGPGLLDMAVVALVLYGYPRLLSYMDSKAILQLDERRMPGFGFLQILSLSPLLLFFAYYAEAPVIAELLAYYLLVYGLWWAANNGTSS